MNLAATIEVGLLAEADAVFVPVRPPGSSRFVSNVMYARRMFPLAGVEWRSGGRTALERKDFELALKDLEGRGRVTIGRPRTKALWAKLSDQAEAESRSLVGLPGLLAARLLMAEVAKHSDRSPSTLDRQWIGEDVLSRHPWGDRDTAPFLLTEEFALPALWRGWLASNGDQQGHVYYALTASGWELVETPLPTDAKKPFRRAAAALYMDRLKRALHVLNTADPANSRELGPLPLPVALKRVPVGAWNPDRSPAPVDDDGDQDLTAEPAEAAP